MRDITKSLFSFSWAMSLFGAKQALNLFTPRGPDMGRSPAAGAFQDVTQSVVGQFGDSLRRVFEAGDQLQQGMVDAMFMMLSPGRMTPGDPTPSRMWDQPRSPWAALRRRPSSPAGRPHAKRSCCATPVARAGSVPTSGTSR